jgi:hypothetical protein
MSSSNDKYVFSTVDAAVAAVAESTTDDSDNSGGAKGPAVPEVKGNDDVAVTKVDEKKKSGVDHISGKDPAREVIVGGGEVAGQEIQVQERAWQRSSAKQRSSQAATPLDISCKSFIKENYYTREW